MCLLNLTLHVFAFWVIICTRLSEKSRREREKKKEKMLVNSVQILCVLTWHFRAVGRAESGQDMPRGILAQVYVKKSLSTPQRINVSIFFSSTIFISYVCHQLVVPVEKGGLVWTTRPWVTQTSVLHQVRTHPLSSPPSMPNLFAPPSHALFTFPLHRCILLCRFQGCGCRGRG